MKPIDPIWIGEYVDSFLAYAAKLPEGSKMRELALMRASYTMDLVKAWKEKCERDMKP